MQERKNFLPSSLPRFISIFLRAFCVQFHLASLLCHVLFLFPHLSLRHSRNRRACSSCFTPSLPSVPPPPYSPSSFSSFFPHNSTLSHTYIHIRAHRRLSLSFPRSFALLIHFTSIVSSLSPLFRPPFSCLSVVSSLLPRPSTRSTRSPLRQPFPLSPRTLVPFAPFPLPPPS